MTINVVGDITGFADTLKALMGQMPQGELWGLGDLIDRGPDSKGVLDYFIDGSHNSLMGNHEHMMLAKKNKDQTGYHYRLYDFRDWDRNGGNQTAKSFGFSDSYLFDFSKIDLKYLEFIEKMPLMKEFDSLILTHAPINDKFDKRIFDIKEINKDPYLMGKSALWNRLKPNKIEGKLQVYGHNSPKKGILWHTDKYPNGIYMHDDLEVPEGVWGVCIDTWKSGYLTGLSINTDFLNNPQAAVRVFREPFTNSDVKAYGKE